MANYATQLGFIQFPVNEREANGEDVRDITIRTPGTEGVLIRITLWPDFAEAEVTEGDFVAVDGTWDTRTVGDTTFINMNASKLAVNGKTYLKASADEKERAVVGKKSATKTF